MIPKFRAYHKNLKQIFEVISISFNHQIMWIKPFNDKEGHVNERLVIFDDVILMQGWTSEYQAELTIYKGDIINVHWFYAAVGSNLGVYEDEINLESVEVVEENGILGFYFEDDFMPLGFVPVHEESFEVCGNIYENPELLKE